MPQAEDPSTKCLKKCAARESEVECGGEEWGVDGNRVRNIQLDMERWRSERKVIIARKKPMDFR